MGTTRSDDGPWQFTGEFKKFFRLDKGPDCEETPDMLEKTATPIDYKMWFLVAMIVCLTLSALICAFQIINLEDKFLTLSGYAIKCRNLVHPRVPPDFDEFITVEAPLAQPEDPPDYPIPQDTILYPARIITESEKPKNQASRKSSQTKTKRSSGSKSSKKPQTSNRSKRQGSKTLNKLETNSSSLVDRENNTKQVILPSYNQRTSNKISSVQTRKQ